MHCKSLWIKASAKCINVNVMKGFYFICIYLFILFDLVLVLKFQFSFVFWHISIKQRNMQNSVWEIIKVKVKKWRDIRPSMVTHTLNSCSAFNPSKVHTHSSEHTHTMNTHLEQWAAIYAAAPGEQLGVRCLAQGHLSCGIEGGETLNSGESAVHSFPPPTIPAGPETRTHNLWVTSPTL